jgi:hypothetical protein
MPSAACFICHYTESPRGALGTQRYVAGISHNGGVSEEMGGTPLLMAGRPNIKFHRTEAADRCAAFDDDNLCRRKRNIFKLLVFQAEFICFSEFRHVNELEVTLI